MGAHTESTVAGEPGKPGIRELSAKAASRISQIHELHTITEAHQPLDTTRMHPLIAAAYNNRIKSPLCRLPDAVLVRLMQLSDHVTVECLRRCSRLFLRLFPLAYTSERESTKQLGSVWPLSMLRWLPGEKDTFLALVARDADCRDCLAARQSPDWPARATALIKTYLHCSGCQADHPACLFSPGERRKEQAKRVCIGHQGQVRLCQHVGVPWSLARSVGERQAQKTASSTTRKDPNVIQCARAGHVRTCEHRRPLQRLFKPTEPAFEAEHARCCPSKPTLSCYFKEGSSDTRFLVLQLSWSSHVSLASKQDGRVQAKDLELGIKELYKLEGRFICPPLAPEPVVGLIIGDPSCCDCVEYPGKTATGWECPPSEWQPEDKKTCRNDHTLGILSYNSVLHNMAFVTNPAYSSYQCNYHWHGGSDAEGGFSHWAYLNRVSESCVRVTYHSRIEVVADGNGSPQQMNRSWYQALDPESYGLTNDADGFGLYWCKTEGCRNYYRFGRSRFRRLLRASDYVHACPA